VINPLSSEPNRGTHEMAEIANGSSKLINHSEIMVDYPTYIDSAPIPKIVLPMSISLKLFVYPPTVMIIYPITANKVKMTSVFLEPILSKRAPPMNGMIQLGAPYRV